MKLANIRYQDKDRLAVALNYEQLLDLTTMGLPANMRQLIEKGVSISATRE